MIDKEEKSRQKQLIELNIIIFNLSQAQKILSTDAKELTQELKMFLKGNSYRLRSTLEYSESFLKNAQLTRDLDN